VHGVALFFHLLGDRLALAAALVPAILAPMVFRP